MKNFLIKYTTFEPPFGEIWLVVGGIFLLLMLGVIKIGTAISWLVPAAILALILISTTLLQRLWTYKVTGVFWYLYSVFILISFFSYIDVLFTVFTTKLNPLVPVLLFITNGLTVVFVSMTLLGKTFFTINFWRYFLVIEVVVFPLMISETVKVLSVVDPTLKLNPPEIILVGVIYLVFSLPYLVRLVKYSF